MRSKHLLYSGTREFDFEFRGLPFSPQYLQYRCDNIGSNDQRWLLSKQFLASECSGLTRKAGIGPCLLEGRQLSQGLWAVGNVSVRDEELSNERVLWTHQNSIRIWVQGQRYQGQVPLQDLVLNVRWLADTRWQISPWRLRDLFLDAVSQQLQHSYRQLSECEKFTILWVDEWFVTLCIFPMILRPYLNFEHPSLTSDSR